MSVFDNAKYPDFLIAVFDYCTLWLITNPYMRRTVAGRMIHLTTRLNDISCGEIEFAATARGCSAIKNQKAERFADAIKLFNVPCA